MKENVCKQIHCVKLSTQGMVLAQHVILDIK